MSDNRRLRAGRNPVHSTNCAADVNTNGPQETSSSNSCYEGIVDTSNGTTVEACAAMSAVGSNTAAPSSTSIGRHLGEGNGSEVITFNTSNVGSDLDVLRVSLANIGLAQSSSNLNVCLDDNGSVIVNGTGIGQLIMDGTVIGNLEQAAIGLGGERTHLIHSDEISSNGIIDERIGLTLSNNQRDDHPATTGNGQCLSNSNLMNGIAHFLSRREDDPAPSNRIIGRTANNIFSNVSLDQANNINTNHFLDQGSVMAQAAMLNPNDLDFNPGDHVILQSSTDNEDVHAVHDGSVISLGIMDTSAQSRLNMGASSVVSSHQPVPITNPAGGGLIGGGLIAVTATANIHHRATISSSNTSSNLVMSSIGPPSDLNAALQGATSSMNNVNRYVLLFFVVLFLILFSH